MARNHAQVYTSIWTDPDFIALSPGAQRMYLLLLSQQNLSHAGLLPLTVKRWANKSANTTVEQVEKWLGELGQARFVLIDEDTEELLIRTLVRRDEVYKQPQVMAAAAKDVRAVASPYLARALAVEMARIRAFDGLHVGSVKILDSLIQDLPDPERRVPEGCEQPDPQALGRGMVTLVSKGSPTPAPSTTPTPATSATPPRDDVTRLCNTLQAHITANGSKQPTITKAWTDAARLMLDRDKRPVDEAAELIRWCQSDPFWQANVLSMPTFRDKYDQLRLQRQRGATTRPSTTDQRVGEALALSEKFAAADRQEITR